MSAGVQAVKGKVVLSDENFPKSMQELEAMLSPGTPVMFRNFSWTDGRERSHRILLFSGGRVSKEGVFNLQKGKRNFSFAMLDGKDPKSYRIVNFWQEELDNQRLHVPKSWISQEFNEGTFSRAGPSQWESVHMGGTNQLIVGNVLYAQFPDAVNALKFARDAVFFKLPSAYSMQNYVITEMGDTGIRSKQEEERTRQTHRIACVRAAMNLLSVAENELGEYNLGLVANQAGHYHEGVKKFRDKGYPADAQDYLIKQLMHPQKNVALVKTGAGVQYGETYILPFRDEMDAIVERAFSADVVRKFYPYGLEK